jgi:hypothetical protein
MALPDLRSSDSEASRGEVQWYQSEIPALTDTALAVFVDYCGLERDMINHHIYDVVSSISHNCKSTSTC